MIFSINDIDWLNLNYPELKVLVLQNRVVIEGEIKFVSSFSTTTGLYTINPLSGIENIISDSYNIQITFNLNSDNFPIIKEVDGRLANLAKKLNINSEDLHVYTRQNSNFSENTLCVVGPLDQINIQKCLTLESLIEKILIPFFYDSSFFELYKKRMREDYSHGVYGVIENYFDIAENQTTQDIKQIVRNKLFNSGDENWKFLSDYLEKSKVIKGHHNCPICKKSPIRKCHARLFFGIRKIQQDKIFSY